MSIFPDGIKELEIICTEVDRLLIQNQERMDNALARMDAIEARMVDYMEANPKCDDQWTEQRLRVLELKVKVIEDGTRGN